jgi:hypothetical protein
MAEAKVLNLLDIHVSSFLSLHGIEPVLEHRSGKVIFTFPATDEVYRLMNRFNSDEAVPVASFVTTLKTLRGKMLTAKESIQGNGKVTSYDKAKNNT